jgi:DNA-binding CsgD family transcriptional regulator
MQAQQPERAMRPGSTKSDTWSAAVDQSGSTLRADVRKQLFSHGEALQALTSQRSLVNCLDSLRGWLGVSDIVAAAGRLDAPLKMRNVASGDDNRWRHLYLREKFVLVDPIVGRIAKGQRFVDRARVIAEQGAAIRRRPRAPTVNRFQEAARDYNRPDDGFATGTVYRGCIVMCSVTMAAPGRHRQQASTLLRALRPVLHEALVRILLPVQPLEHLSERELVVLECLASGHSDTEIAARMAISESTVRFHLGNVFEKLGARNRCHAVSIGFQSGVLQR